MREIFTYWCLEGELCRFCLLLLTFVSGAAGWCWASRGRRGTGLGRVRVRFNLTRGENRGKWALDEQRVPDPRICNPSAGVTSARRNLPDVLRSGGTPRRREGLRFQLVIGTNCLKCINATPEECFIIEVIAVFSRLTFVSGVDWNHRWLSYLWEKFYLSEASIFRNTAGADNAGCPQVFSLQSKMILLSVLKTASWNFLRDLNL